METILIDKNRMKIVLNKKDTEKYVGNSEDTAAGIENSIREILHDASSNTSFSVNNGCFFAELYLSCDGSCEIFITRTEDEDMVDQNKESEKAYRITESKNSDSFIYMFDNTENFLAFCKELSIRNFSDKCKVYYDSHLDMFCIEISEEFWRALEFGGKKCSNIEKYYISEHSKVLCDGVESILAKLAI